MSSRRLSNVAKSEILDEFLLGGTANQLAKKYNCSPNTINRTVKSLLTKEEYILLKEERAIFKKNKKSMSLSENSDLSIEEGESKNIGKSISLNNEDDSDLQLNRQDEEGDIIFEEILPLESSFGFESQQQQVDCKNLEKVNLPESVYMLVDKKVELESQYISDLPEWSFLPEAELERLVILLFPNQRTAKRNCSKNQKVLKVPNTDIFKISKPYLLSKGITRLIFEDLLISLENQ